MAPSLGSSGLDDHLIALTRGFPGGAPAAGESPRPRRAGWECGQGHNGDRRGSFSERGEGMGKEQVDRRRSTVRADRPLGGGLLFVRPGLFCLPGPRNKVGNKQSTEPRSKNNGCPPINITTHLLFTGPTAQKIISPFRTVLKFLTRLTENQWAMSGVGPSNSITTGALRPPAPEGVLIWRRGKEGTGGTCPAEVVRVRSAGGGAAFMQLITEKIPGFSSAGRCGHMQGRKPWMVSVQLLQGR